MMPCRAAGCTVTLSLTPKERVVYCVRSKDPSGVPPRISLPRPFRCVLPRIATNRWLVNRYARHRNDARLELSAPDGCRFAVWQLNAGDCVYMSMRHLVAWSEGVRFRSRLCFQLAGMAIGRMIFVSAEGPGTLVFETRGEPSVLGPNPEPSFTFDFNRVIAWSSQVKFKLTGSSKFCDIYMTPMHVQPVTQGFILKDADDRSAHGGGLLKHIFERIYMPQ